MILICCKSKRSQLLLKTSLAKAVKPGGTLCLLQITVLSHTKTLDGKISSNFRPSVSTKFIPINLEHVSEQHTPLWWGFSLPLQEPYKLSRWWLHDTESMWFSRQGLTATFFLRAQAICMHRAHDYQFITLSYPQPRSLLSSIAKANVRAYRASWKHKSCPENRFSH